MINGMENLDIELIRKDVKNLHEKLHTAFTKGRIEQMTKEDIENSINIFKIPLINL